ncbi:MAG TPA: glycosyltransferase [Phycisphaerae bacterium]|nr:glycosyltransferase [Phycisphaerae bacterium]
MNVPSTQPMFTVVMPVYNHAAYVAQAVESVLAQTFGDWELYIVDDGSTDETPGIVDDLASRDARILAIHQTNAGPAAARNAAIRQARGEWMAYLDSDDLWLPDALACYAEFIARRPDAKFLYGYRHRLDDDGTITELPGEFQLRPTGAAELFGRMYLSHLCVCYRRSLLEESGLYDATLRSCEDYELYLRMSLRCTFEPLGKATGLRRRHGTNLSRQTGRSRMLEAEVLRRFIERQGGAALVPPEQVRTRLGRLYYAAARQYFKARCYRQSLTALACARRYGQTLKGTLIALASRALLPLGTDDGRPLPKLD